ncbi:MAG: hypothetical protein EB059_03555 [Alphaproteobacteria bacterium]|nr:hypothetical protein [Alphaproteobacteria bacterium]
MKKTRKSSRRADDASLTKSEMKTARPLRDVFPDLAAYGRHRAAKGEGSKQAVSIRLSPQVVAYFKSKGAGWQTRINDALEAFVNVAR